jgi:hypothetical protein
VLRHDDRVKGVVVDSKGSGAIGPQILVLTEPSCKGGQVGGVGGGGGGGSEIFISWVREERE